MRTKSSQKRGEFLVKDWNTNNPLGVAVTVRLDSGELRKTTTRSEAQLLGGHTPVIWLDGIAGAYALERVTTTRSKE